MGTGGARALSSDPVPPARPTRPLARLAGAGLAALALVGAGCAGEEDVTREDFEEKLVDRLDGAITEDEAICLTDRVYEEFDQEQVNTIVWAATEDELSAGVQEKLRAINDECVGDASQPSTTTTEAQEGGSTTTAPAASSSTTTTAPG